jgi:hypothetical protein
MYNDPKQIYLWAKKYVKFSSNNSENEVILKFIEKVNEYIELDVDNSEMLEDSNNTLLDVDNIEPINSDNVMLKNSGLQLLARLIRLSHGNNKKNIGLTMPFDFSKFFSIYIILKKMAL